MRNSESSPIGLAVVFLPILAVHKPSVPPFELALSHAYVVVRSIRSPCASVRYGARYPMLSP